MHLFIRVNLTLNIGGTQSPSPTPILKIITEKIHSKYSHQDGLGYGPIFPIIANAIFQLPACLRQLLLVTFPHSVYHFNWVPSLFW